MLYSRDDLKDYCLRKLGAPVIQINVDDTQIEDRIDDALHKFHEFHSDGAEKQYRVHVITNDNITNKYFEVGEDVLTINKIFPLQVGMHVGNLAYASFITDLMNPSLLKGRGLHGYEIAQQYLSTLDQFFNREKTFQFNRYTTRVNVNTDWSQFTAGDSILLECSIVLNADDYYLFWNSDWLKAYATALIKEQWGNNLSKYGGFQLPSGITLNGDRILAEAKVEIAELDQELYDIWQTPVDFAVG